MENMVIMLSQLKNTYQNKRVFLTGHTGFKGAWLLKILSILGANVKGYSLAPENEFDLYHLLNGDAMCDSVIADLRDREHLNKAITDFNPDFVFHLAAQPLVRLSYKNPSETFEVNAIGTANLLDGVRALKNACSVILITTDKVYHNHEWIYPYRETDRLGGFDPYSASKACAELVIDSYRNSFFHLEHISSHQKGIAVARAGNVIGGGDWAEDRLIPDIVRALAKDDAVSVRNPSSVRPWQHVLEPLFGYLRLGEKLMVQPAQFSGAFNFGPNAENTITVQEMVLLTLQSWGSGRFEVIQQSHQPHEAGLLKLDISKVSDALGWKPMMNAALSVEKTIQWYKAFHSDPDSIISFTEEQIKAFSNG